MRMTREQMLSRTFARDRRFNGTFLVGVMSTGIYCLPSCPARNPKAENIQFFRTEEEAQAAGLRPCKRCRPDLFYRNINPEERIAAGIAQRIHEQPGDYANVVQLAQAAGVGVTKLTHIFRSQYHTTPAAFLQRERIRYATRLLLQNGTSVVDAALEAGFESPTTFHANMRRWAALRPGEIKHLAEENRFTLLLPSGYRSDLMLRAHSRDADGIDLRVDGNHLSKAVRLPGGPAVLAVDFGLTLARTEVKARWDLSAEDMGYAHRIALRLLGLHSDPGPFERRMVTRPETRFLVNGHRGMRIPQTADPFEGLVWVIFGQAVTLNLARHMRRALLALCGIPVEDGLIAHPDPETVAKLDVEELTRRRVSRFKAEYLVNAARLIANGDLPLDSLGDLPVGTIERTLLNVRGIGPWSVQYLLMRSYGFSDCVPVGDSGLTTALERYFGLDSRPDVEMTRALMRRFTPYRSLATYHLWMSLGEKL